MIRRRIWIPAAVAATILATITATHFWSWHPATPLGVAVAAYAAIAAVRLTIVARRRRARRALEQHWADVTAIFRDQARTDVTLPLAVLALLLTGSALTGALVLLVATVAAGRRGLTVDERDLLTAAQPTTEDNQ